MGSHAQGGRMTAGSNNRPAAARAQRLPLWGPLSLLGLAVAAAAACVDQATKLWLIFGFHLKLGERVALTPFLDLTFTRNTGISYGLFPQEGPLGQWALLALKVIATILLWLWLARITSRLTAVALGLIIGGAIGNAIDRLAYGWVVDFVLLHIGEYEWYVFNLADAAIVLGVVVLLYEALLLPDAAKAP
jgi:signal peptidase II